MEGFVYLTNCTQSDGASINRMVERARQISRRTFLQYVDKESLRRVEEILGYESHPSRGLTMAGDCYVTYWKSVWRGQPCVYFDQSAIEFVFGPART